MNRDLDMKTVKLAKISLNEVSEELDVADGYVEKVETERFTVAVIHLNPQMKYRLGLHHHQKKESLFMVLEGRGKATVNGKEIILEPGITIIVPPKEKHHLFLGMIPLDDTPLTLIEIGSPVEEGHIFAEKRFKT